MPCYVTGHVPTLLHLDYKYEVFVVYIAVFSIDSGEEVYPSRIAQISYLKSDEVLNRVFREYTDLANVFLLKLVIELLKYMGINNHDIKLIDN